MQGDMSSGQEKAVLELMTRITSIVDLNTLLDVVVNELPGVVGARGCWIYLQSDYVPKYNGLLERGENKTNEEKLLEHFDDFIVLAATNLDSKKSFIGKAYFGIGEGITGWVYKNTKPLRINDVTDADELKSLAADLLWANEYHDGDELYESGDKRPLLAVPLMLDDTSIGTLKFHATLNKQPFSDLSQEIAIIVSHIISGVIRQSWMVEEQSQLISRLIETSNKEAYLDVIINVTKSMKDMLNCTIVEFFLKSEDGIRLDLVAKNGEKNAHQSKEVDVVNRGDGLIGWVFKTGHPLIIPNIKEYTGGVLLDDTLLETISDGVKINDEDRLLKYEQDTSHPTTNRLQSISLVAVPVISKDREVTGVLCGYRNLSAKSRYPLDRNQLLLATSFANTISLVLENNKQKILGELLTELGNITQTDLLLQKVTESIPKLVASLGCSIFTAELRQGVRYLRLTHTSRQDFIQYNGRIPVVEYELGEAKTGLCGLFQSTLLTNHYGKGKYSIENLDLEVKRISSLHPNDITSVLVDDSKNKVGLFHLQLDDKLPIAQRVSIRNYAKAVIYQSMGIESRKIDPITIHKSGGTWSFVAVPIASDKKLLGVITLARSIPETPFSLGDVLLLKSIAGRLASVMNNIRILQLREKLLMSLAHEINTPITGILADSQNLLAEVTKNTELQKIVNHNLGQVLRLHMQASAIMAVLSEKDSTPQFTKHSIYKPLIEACELFESEATQNGCHILGPKAVDGNFPSIEMSLFDLTIAFKNIVHNAVKYSFRPPINKDVHRTIKVWGQWDRKQPNFYNVYVQNYGVGIKPHEIEKRLIFEPYYRGEYASDRKRTGTGFGLAHAKLVIEDIHHGFIDVNCVPQGGAAHLTTFSISLPTAQPK